MNTELPAMEFTQTGVIINGRSLSLRASSKFLLQEMMRVKGGIVTFDRCCSILWRNPDQMPDRFDEVLKQHIHRLRKALKGHGVSIQNEFRVGYRLVVSDDVATSACAVTKLAAVLGVRRHAVVRLCADAETPAQVILANIEARHG